jgi:hypothetical protein
MMSAKKGSRGPQGKPGGGGRLQGGFPAARRVRGRGSPTPTAVADPPGSGPAPPRRCQLYLWWSPRIPIPHAAASVQVYNNEII